MKVAELKELKEVSVKDIFNNGMKPVEALYDEFPWENEGAYAEWLAQTYFFVCHSTRLLCASASRFSLADNKLHLRFLDHMKEERSHEILALRDLENLGYKIENFSEYAETTAFYQSQYHLIEHNDPAALLGYILCLEGISVSRGKMAHEKVNAQFGPDAVTFWKVHAEDDISHLPKAIEQAQSLKPQARAAVIKSFEMSVALYIHMLRRIMMEHAKPVGRPISEETYQLSV